MLNYVLKCKKIRPAGRVVCLLLRAPAARCVAPAAAAAAGWAAIGTFN